MVLTRVSLWLGPMLRLRWWAEGDTDVDVERRGTLWVEQSALLYLKHRLVPMSRADSREDCPGECWVWVGSVDANGVPMAYNNGQQWSVPRLLYTIQHGPLTPRQQVYNLCGTVRCCRPDHFRVEERGPIPRKPVVRGTVPVCASGHPQTAENVYTYKGKSYCRVCHSDAQRRYRSRGGRTSSASRSLG